MHFLNLYNLYSETIITELENLPIFIIGRHNLNIRYADDAMLMAGSERKWKVLLDKVVKENNTKELTIKCMKVECIVVSKRKRPSYDLFSGDIKIKQVQKFNYLGRIIQATESDVEI